MDHVLRVLVVDDDSFMCVALRQVFTSVGVAVETFVSAAELLARADLNAPAVLVLDVKMPGMSGPELQGLLRQRGVALPVIFLSGSADLPLAVTAMRNGAVDFLEKPFDKAVLLARVHQAFARYGEPGAQPSGSPRADCARRLATLTPREREVYDRMITGESSKVMARELGGSFRTIEIHRGRVMSKMAAANLAGLVRMAWEGQVVV